VTRKKGESIVRSEGQREKRAEKKESGTQNGDYIEKGGGGRRKDQRKHQE